MRLVSLLLFSFGCIFANDYLKELPLLETSYSEKGQFRVTVKARDFWKTPVSVIILEEKNQYDNKVWRILYKKELKHLFRPKFFEVNNNGVVVMFDDWDNSPSPRSIVIKGIDGNDIKTMSFDDLVSDLKITEEKFLKFAKPSLGWWLSGRPYFLIENLCSIPTAGGTMILFLDQTKNNLYFLP